MVPLNTLSEVITCNAVGWPPPEVEWLSSSEEVVDVDSNSGAYVSKSLSFLIGFMPIDEGSYVCLLQTSLTNESESVLLLPAITGGPEIRPCHNIESSTVSIHHRVLTMDCLEWSESTKEEIASNFNHVLIGGILSQCPNCSSENGTDLRVTIEELTCSREKPGAALFRTTISDEDPSQTEAVFCALKNWWEFQPLVRVDDGLYVTDRDCVIYVNSTGECMDPKNMLSTPPIPPQSNLPILLVFVGAIVGAVFLTFLVSILLIFLVYKYVYAHND